MNLICLTEYNYNIKLLFSIEKETLALNKKKSYKEFLSPFMLVIFLTITCILLSINFLHKQDAALGENIFETFIFWKDGFFSLMGFTLQMMMILVLGYCLAVVKPIHFALKRISKYPKSQMQGVLFVGGITMIAGIINWGFGLIIGALFARFVTIAQQEKGLESNPALLASAGYLGMAVWHGGLSASAPLKAAEKGHFLEDIIGVIPITETVFTSFNFLVIFGLGLVYLITLGLLAKGKTKGIKKIRAHPLRPIPVGDEDYIGRTVGIVIILVAILSLVKTEAGLSLSLDLNTVNFLLFGITLFAYRSLPKFTEAIGEGIRSSADIFIQFPFYAGILGVLTSSGVLDVLSSQIIEIASRETLPVFTLLSSAFVNLVVPSGGGQWAVQGPVLMESAKALDLPIGKIILVFSYGDQLTNLLQPFWALPLLSITGVSAPEVLKYTFWLFLASLVYMVFVAIFFI